MKALRKAYGYSVPREIRLMITEIFILPLTMQEVFAMAGALCLYIIITR